MKLINILRRTRTEKVDETTLPTEKVIIERSVEYQQREGMDPFVAIVLSSIGCLALNLKGTPIGEKAETILNIHRSRPSNSMEKDGLWEIMRDVEDINIVENAKELIIEDCPNAIMTHQYSQEHLKIISMIIHVTAEYMEEWNRRN